MRGFLFLFFSLSLLFSFFFLFLERVGKSGLCFYVLFVIDVIDVNE